MVRCLAVNLRNLGCNEEVKALASPESRRFAFSVCDFVCSPDLNTVSEDDDPCLSRSIFAVVVAILAFPRLLEEVLPPWHGFFGRVTTRF